MATLVSHDLRCRLQIGLLGYEMRGSAKLLEAESRHDLNFLRLRCTIGWRDGATAERQTRAVSWELHELAEMAARVAAGERAAFASAMLDSACRVHFERSTERSDRAAIVALIGGGGGALPVDFVPHWERERLVGQRRRGLLGVQFSTNLSALALFAGELAQELAGFPLRLPTRRPDGQLIPLRD